MVDTLDLVYKSPLNRDYLMDGIQHRTVTNSNETHVAYSVGRLSLSESFDSIIVGEEPFQLW